NIQSDRLAVDSRGNTALFEVNGGALYWVEQGQLRRQRAGNAGDAGGMATYLGDVLPGQTYFWLGAEFGLGLYRAGNFNVAFIVDGQRSRLDDHLQIPPWQGQLVDATCAFSAEYAWLFLTTQEQGQLRDRCVVVRRDGTVMAMTVATEGDGSWLATLGNGRSRADPCPYLASGSFLLAPTDEGIIRIDLVQGHLHHTQSFPDTEPFVDSHARLLPGNGDLVVVTEHTITRLVMAPATVPTVPATGAKSKSRP
ncbi:MAG TPA: hypothetical protein V6C88_10960, partial [Chroococcidiopsis sp.]